MIRSNTCPYCGARYGIAWAGCERNCRDMQRHAALVQAAIDADLREEDEYALRDHRPV